MKKRLLLAMVIFLVVGISYAGEQEDLLARLRIAILENQNAQMAVQLSKRNLDDVVKVIREQGYIINQGENGLEIIKPPPPPQPQAQPQPQQPPTPKQPPAPKGVTK